MHWKHWLIIVKTVSFWKNTLTVVVDNDSIITCGRFWDIWGTGIVKNKLEKILSARVYKDSQVLIFCVDQSENYIFHFALVCIVFDMYRAVFDKFFVHFSEIIRWILIIKCFNITGLSYPFKHDLWCTSTKCLTA